MTSGTTIKSEISPVARHIARVAAKLFAERGYDATSVREIVEAAGVAKPTLYYYFRSKEGLAQALLTVPLNGLAATLRHLVTTVERSDPLPGRGDGGPVRLLPGGSGSGSVHLCPAFRAAGVGGGRRAGAIQGRPVRVRTEAAVRRLAEAGIVSRERVEACSSACRGLIVISTLDYLYGEKPLGQDLAQSTGE